MPLTAKLIVGSGAVALSLFAGSGIASAEPDVSAIVNTTCTYPQIMAALNVQSPEAAQQVNASPIAGAWLQQFVASPRVKRQQMVDEVKGMPAVQEYTVLINQVATSCRNY
ncbi:hemophore-related protein [Mycobacterium sp. CBMA271]|uniref:hemophore-related protein n=1 Tax=unclassified Mycobacteroides TaxID=2618759 RepID=UPI0012DEB4EE|nr:MULTISPECIES: hemophore-related protein [unclassified Mycobacteroides]MUM23129.1 hemophore-related protein [Mycobacteroides sp. CBMA 271]